MRTFFRSAVCVAILVLGWACGQQTNQPAKEISAEELAKLLEQPGKIFFLDVREPEEIARLGSVKNYVNIPLSQLEKRIGEVPKDKLIVTL
jgi:rhodanese-related sulfurtransferase